MTNELTTLLTQIKNKSIDTNLHKYTKNHLLTRLHTQHSQSVYTWSIHAHLSA